MVNQKSLDNDDAELSAIADSNKSDHISRERRNSHNIVRYRPETPRTVTPVRFTPIPRLPNKGFKSPEPEKVKSPGLKSPTPNLKSPEPCYDVNPCVLFKPCLSSLENSITVIL